MMMRQIESYLIEALLIVALAGIIFISVHPAFGAVAGNQNLKEGISQYQDTHMTVEDLAFSWPLTTTTQHPKTAMSK